MVLVTNTTLRVGIYIADLKIRNKETQTLSCSCADGGKISASLLISVSVTKQKPRFAVEGGHRRTNLFGAFTEPRLQAEYRAKTTSYFPKDGDAG